jgi:hypothetical protein
VTAWQHTTLDEASRPWGYPEESPAQPAVRVKGKGLDTIVTIGKRTVAFDGERIVLGRVR